MIELGLQRISRLLAKTPLTWRAVHVAGTNGKGSICAYVSAMFDVYNTSRWRQSSQTAQAELRHGRFTSPHLVNRWDCITINNKTVTFSVFEQVEKKVLERNRKEALQASEFELLTATAFEIFTQESVDVAVVEVGMGGRLDATNILGEANPDGKSEVEVVRPLPVVSAISSIGLDHQAFLGDTLQKIAQEKAGIIKPGVPVVFDSSTQSHDVVQVLNSAATQIGCDVFDVQRFPSNGALATSDVLSLLDANSPQSPAHMKSNALIAFYSAWMAILGLRIDSKTDERKPSLKDLDLTDLQHEMIKAIKTVQFPGRQQFLSMEKLTGRREHILLDGAHNAQSAQALVSVIRGLRSRNAENHCVTWIVAASDTKDVKEILAPLLEDGDAIFGVEFGPVDGMPWVKPMSAGRLLEAAREVITGPESLRTEDCGSDLLSALKSASSKAGGGPLVIAGSLYLVGDVLRLLRDS